MGTAKEGGGGGGDASTLSFVSKKYDLTGKGYLDETEQQMRDRDLENHGSLSKADVYKIVEDLQKEKRTSRERLYWAIAMVLLVLLLAVSNIGTAYLAVYLSKETEVNSEGLLVTSDGKHTAVFTKARGLSFHLQPTRVHYEAVPGSNKTMEVAYDCITERQLAEMYHGVTQGASVVFELQEEEETNTYGVSDSHATATESEVCFSLSGDEEEGGMVCALLQPGPDYDCGGTVNIDDAGNDQGHHGRFLSNIDCLKHGRNLDESGDGLPITKSGDCFLTPKKNGCDCVFDVDCKSGRCAQGTCKAPLLANGEECNYHRDCNSKNCHGDVEDVRDCFDDSPKYCHAKVGNGGYCCWDNECKSDFCSSVGAIRSCESSNRAEGESCYYDEHCASNQCNMGLFICEGASGSNLSNGETCTYNEQCASNLCLHSSCQSSNRPTGASCADNQQCASNKCEWFSCT